MPSRIHKEKNNATIKKLELLCLNNLSLNTNNLLLKKILSIYNRLTSSAGFGD